MTEGKYARWLVTCIMLYRQTAYRRSNTLSIKDVMLTMIPGNPIAETGLPRNGPTTPTFDVVQCVVPPNLPLEEKKNKTWASRLCDREFASWH